MKEATGELSSTVITIIAIVAIGAILTVFLLPQINGFVKGSWSNLTGQKN